MYILIIILAFNSYAVTTQEFTSKDKCEAAKEWAETSIDSSVKVIRAKCFRK